MMAAFNFSPMYQFINTQKKKLTLCLIFTCCVKAYFDTFSRSHFPSISLFNCLTSTSMTVLIGVIFKVDMGNSQRSACGWTFFDFNQRNLAIDWKEGHDLGFSHQRRQLGNQYFSQRLWSNRVLIKLNNCEHDNKIRIDTQYYFMLNNVKALFIRKFTAWEVSFIVCFINTRIL